MHLQLFFQTEEKMKEAEPLKWVLHHVPPTIADWTNCNTQELIQLSNLKYK